MPAPTLLFLFHSNIPPATPKPPFSRTAVFLWVNISDLSCNTARIWPTDDKKPFTEHALDNSPYKSQDSGMPTLANQPDFSLTI
ncbi:hypothetical protein, partial [Pseudomonas sp.]|uniref:hypothetical protein n=1 Tax=Pseudomonas sp. TaxID=306 RepID=UPI003FD7C4DD